MKSIIALVAVLALTGTVDAATKAKARSAKASKGTRVAAVKKPQVEDVSSAASDVQLSERAKLTEVKPIVQAKKWSLRAYNETYGAQINSTNNGTLGKTINGKVNGGLTSDNGVLAGYKIADTVTVSAAYEWEQTYGTGDNAVKATMYDPSIRLAKSDLADLGNGVNLSGQVRYYAPVSEDSQDREQLGVVRLYGTATREITKALSASFTLNPRIYMQQNDTYINAAGKPTNLDTFRLWSFAGMKYAVNEQFAIEQTFGVYQKWKTNTPRADFLDASTSVYYAPVSWLELNLGIRQIDGSTDARKTGLSNLYNDDQTEYFLITSMSI